jgi:biopolymer transport protein ExbB/TolQ
MTTDPATPATLTPPSAPSPFSAEDFQLAWSKRDIEQRLGFRGGRFTTVNRWLSFLLGLAMTCAFYGAVIFALQRVPSARWLTAMFLERGPCPYATMFFFFWAIAILWLKSSKLRLQAEALRLSAVPQQPDFELTPASARAVLDRIHSLVDSTTHFLLLNRIERALSNLKNIGQVSDVASILKTQAEYDEEQMTSSYGLVNGFVWAIPVLGFIGTVLGLSAAIGKFGTTLQREGDLSGIKESLQGVTAGLATAFETTLIALVAALIVQLLITFMQSREGEFLDACNDYCHASVAAKLRLGGA